MSTECIWQVTLSLFSDLFIKIAHCILSTLLYLFCLEIHQKSVGSPLEVRRTENLTSMTGFYLCLSEIQWKSSGRPTDTEFQPVQPFLASKWFEWTFTGLWPDYQWNPVMSNGLRRTSDRLSAESIGNGRVWQKSVGIHWTSSGSIKYWKVTMKYPRDKNEISIEIPQVFIWNHNEISIEISQVLISKRNEIS